MQLSKWFEYCFAPRTQACFACRRALNCLEALARGAEDRATLNVFPRWHDHGLEAAQGGFGNRGQQRELLKPWSAAFTLTAAAGYIICWLLYSPCWWAHRSLVAIKSPVVEPISSAHSRSAAICKLGRPLLAPRAKL